MIIVNPLFLLFDVSGSLMEMVLPAAKPTTPDRTSLLGGVTSEKADADMEPLETTQL